MVNIGRNCQKRVTGLDLRIATPQKYALRPQKIELSGIRARSRLRRALERKDRIRIFVVLERF